VSITTYTELKSAVADFLNRDDLTSAIPTFISLAEADIARKVRHWLQEKKVRTSLDEPYEFLPDDWLATISLRHSDGTEIKQVGVTEMAELDKLTIAGKPQYYRVEAGRIELYPEPNDAYPADLVYYARVPSLSDAAPTNWLLTNHPDILLYGALTIAAPYLSEDARVTIWGSLYTSAVEALQMDSEKARYSGPLRARFKL
jgi:hypothetical protein